MSLEQCAIRMTALLARPARKKASRALMASLPKRDRIVVLPTDYAVQVMPTQAEIDKSRYDAWKARGCPPSPPAAPKTARKKLIAAQWHERNPLHYAIVKIQMGNCPICWNPMALLYLTYPTIRPRYNPLENTDGFRTFCASLSQ